MAHIVASADLCTYLIVFVTCETHLTLNTLSQYIAYKSLQGEMYFFHSRSNLISPGQYCRSLM